MRRWLPVLLSFDHGHCLFGSGSVFSAEFNLLRLLCDERDIRDANAMPSFKQAGGKAVRRQLPKRCVMPSS